MSARSAINLLPWREIERVRRSRTVFGALAGAVLAGVVLVSAADLTLRQRIEAQDRRNRLLETEITVLEGRIEEVRNLRALHKRLLARAEVINRLRNSRPETVRIFDELANTMTQGVHYLRIERRGDALAAEGIAASARLVSGLMRNLETSEPFAAPRLQRIREDAENVSYGPGASTFELTFAQAVPAGAAILGGVPQT